MPWTLFGRNPAGRPTCEPGSLPGSHGPSTTVGHEIRRLVALVVFVTAASSCSGAGTRVAGSTAPGSLSAASTTAPAATSTPTVFAGQVQQIYSNGDFILNDGHTAFTVVMSPTTALINLRGRQVPSQYIQVGGSIEVTGTRAGLDVNALTVLVPTSKDGS